MEGIELKRILHINSNYLTSKLHENLMVHLEKYGFDNTIYMPIKIEKKQEIKFDSSFNVLNPVTFKNRDKFFFTWKQFKIFKQLKRCTSIDRYDLIHAHTLFTDGNVAYKLNILLDKPYVVTVRGDTDLNFFKLRINLRKRGKDILRNASKIIFLSKTHRDELIEKYIKDRKLAQHILSNSIIIPNGIDDFWFENQGTKKKLLNSKSVKIISVGQVTKRKNQLGTLKAAKILNDRFGIKTTVSIVGAILDQDYADELNKCQSINVKFYKFIPKNKLVDLYRENDIFILPSFRETFGLVYPEAMSQGLPIIYSVNQGFYKQFDEGYVGYAVDPNKPEEIAQKVISILDHYSDLSMNSIKAYKNYDWKILSRKLINVYENIVSEKG